MANLKNDVDNTNFYTALGATPASTDTITLYRWATRFLSNCSTLGAVDLTSFLATRGWSGNFDADPLVIQCNQATSVFTIRSSGQIFRLQSGGGTIKQLVFDPASAMLLDYNASICPLLRAYGGEFYGGSSLNLTVAHFARNARARLLESANAVTTLNLRDNAWVETQRDFTTANIYNGCLKINHVDVTPGTINQFGGMTQWMTGGASGGTLNAYSGVLDFSACEANITFAGGILDRSVIVRKPKSGATVDLSALTAQGGEADYE
jgi:hypothetical protein